MCECVGDEERRGGSPHWLKRNVIIYCIYTKVCVLMIIPETP